MTAAWNNAKESREENHHLVRRLLAECEVKFSSTDGEMLIGCRLDTPVGQKFFQDQNCVNDAPVLLARQRKWRP